MTTAAGRSLAFVSAIAALALLALVGPVGAIPRDLPRAPTATGTGGAVATVDPLASAAALEVLRKGGNAVDAAVTAAAVLGVTDPFSCGIGGGGFLVAYLAEEGRVVTIDHRERAPAAMRPDSFIDPSTGSPYPFPERVTSGLGVGVPGTVAGWADALARYGTLSLKEALKPAIKIARHGFVVDRTFSSQVEGNLARFRDVTSTAEAFLVGGSSAPEEGSVFENEDLADTLALLAKEGPEAFYRGRLAAEIAAAVRRPPVRPGATRNVRSGLMTEADLADYRTVARRPTHVEYRGYDVYGMGPPSSGGSTIGEALNILEGFDAPSLSRAQALHLMLEASRLAFADRNAYLGDADHVSVPLTGLLSEAFATERRALVDPARAGTSPVAPGDPYPHDDGSAGAGTAAASSATEGISTTHITVADRFGNAVAYTYTIEAVGGSGIVVPGRGFLLNNELTDFDPVPPHPNAPDGGKRPRSSMSPTIVLRDGRPVLALGSPGGSTIITTVLQMLVDHLDLGASLPDALAAPRLSQRNTPTTLVEPAFLDTPQRAYLEALGHRFAPTVEIGAATGIAFLPGGRMVAAAEPTRRGGGSAMVLEPSG